MKNYETKEQYEARCLNLPLSVQGKSTDHIWTMGDCEGYIGVRFDCGDAGTLYLTEKQARYLIEELEVALGIKPDPQAGGEGRAE